MEQTLILLKPDCLEAKAAGEVIGRFEAAGFAIVAAKVIQLRSDSLREHYAHVADKPFYPEIEAFMSSRPVIALVLEGKGVIDRVRELLGPTDSTAAPKGTIRGDLGTDKMKNIAHASDSPENARAEIARFFRPGEVVG
jgi:nucleoside-diphosphate kinase